LFIREGPIAHFGCPLFKSLLKAWFLQNNLFTQRKPNIALSVYQCNHSFFQEMQSESIESQLAEEKCLLEQKYASMLQQVLAEKQLVRFSGEIVN